MKYKIIVGGVMGVPITFLDKFVPDIMGGGTKYSDLLTMSDILDNLNATQLSMENISTTESSLETRNCSETRNYFKNQFKIVKFRKGNDDKDLSVNGKSYYFRILIRRI